MWKWGETQGWRFARLREGRNQTVIKHGTKMGSIELLMKMERRGK